MVGTAHAQRVRAGLPGILSEGEGQTFLSQLGGPDQEGEGGAGEACPEGRGVAQALQSDPPLCWMAAQVPPECSGSTILVGLS